MKKWLIGLALVCSVTTVDAQGKKGIVAGPMMGQVELRTAKIWLEAGEDAKTVAVKYWKKGNPASANTRSFSFDAMAEFKPMQVEIGGLDFNTTYEYTILYNNKDLKQGGEFTTKDLWQWRKPAPDFSFLTGSCNYVNEPPFDRPGKPYGGDSSIFATMAKDKAAFMLWLGDNWYTREVDYASEWGMWYRASHDRSAPIMQSLLKAMPQFAIWDDHDYGPNDMGTTFHLRETAREVFKQYWANPSYGYDGKGIYTKFSYSDVDFFLLDDRTWRSEDRMPSNIYGQPNPEKRMLGVEQMNWLKQSLLYSNATFKVIVVGSQVLNPVSPFDKLANFPVEYNELMGFLEDQKVNGVMFLTGDRHHSEVIKVDRTNNYPLYDITVSPLTSGTHKFGGPEKDNPYRVFGLDQKQNYGRISVSGARGERKFTVAFVGVGGEALGEWSVSEKELKSR
ncbi:alkaline phosphatase family protein [Flavihumibacter rivuli]|uniref:alkaline phosphatase D family protein n=1 Tax=Flavihumibacter rivuli TaxID=2838156 RepID=UPI001BDF354F|nr:alkaline phosphatase D family protein [Flavihumibacter rivuli]ULQ55022.1 alkaline phosphatase family protein [Flavihumibacter rivuli]